MHTASVQSLWKCTWSSVPKTLNFRQPSQHDLDLKLEGVGVQVNDSLTKPEPPRFQVSYIF